MEKLKLHTPDLVAINIQKIGELFPQCITEARDEQDHVMKSIDFDELRQLLSHQFAEGPAERYHLDWPGKRASVLAANASVSKTVRPDRLESVEFENTSNIFIEGDNLDALKIIQETYLGKVKLIYIDPPYNTGRDFIYSDRFALDTRAFLRISNQEDELGQKLVTNPTSNGRFHSDWLCMIYPRLQLARNLLRDDGVIFISIDGTELATLRLLCDEIFGASNHCGIVSRVTGTRMGSGTKTIASELDYILIYSKKADVEFVGLPMSDDDASIYDQKDEKGTYLLRSLRRTGGENRREDRPSMYYSVEAPDGTKVLPIAPAGYESRWVCSASTYASLVKEGMIEWRMIERDGVARWQVYQKHYLGDGLKQPSNLWNDEEGNKKATRDLNSMFEGLKVFDHPKPIGLLQKIVTLATSPEDHHIVMDFFAGSGTTAHAVLAQNILDGGNRRYILVQIPEPLDSNNRAQQVAVQVCQKLGLPPTVAELTKERIRRASTILKRELPPIGGQAPDLGFRVLKIDSSNMKDVYYVPDHVEQRDLLLQVSNVKPERTPEDLLFQILVDWGVDLGLPISEETIGGRSVFFVDRNALAACFDLHVTEEFIKEIAKRNPLRVVFRDGSFGDDSAKINAEQIFKLLSPSTEIRSI